MKGKSTFTRTEADEIYRLIEEKLTADSNGQKRIRDRIRKLGFYASDFGIGGGYTVKDFMRVATIVGGGYSVSPSHSSEPLSRSSTPKRTSSSRSDSDEAYAIDLCDELLGKRALRQHRFEWLKGDAGTLLPVDAFYPALNLVVEYMERQHTEAVPHFDKRMTVSGMSRGEQRRLYDQRRQSEIPKQGIALVTVHYHELAHAGSKQLLRDRVDDLRVLGQRLRPFVG
jgi:hypothetical protein